MKSCMINWQINLFHTLVCKILTDPEYFFGILLQMRGDRKIRNKDETTIFISPINNWKIVGMRGVQAWASGIAGDTVFFLGH